MGLLENQIQAALTLQKGEAVISLATNVLVQDYAELNPLGAEEFEKQLLELVRTCKMWGEFNEFHQTHLRNG